MDVVFGTFTARGEKLAQSDGIRGVDMDLIVKLLSQAGTVPSLCVAQATPFRLVPLRGGC